MPRPRRGWHRRTVAASRLAAGVEAVEAADEIASKRQTQASHAHLLRSGLRVALADAYFEEQVRCSMQIFEQCPLLCRRHGAPDLDLQAFGRERGVSGEWAFGGHSPHH